MPPVVEGWDKIEEVPQEVIDNAASYLVASMRGDKIVGPTRQEANALLILLTPYSSLASRIIDGD